MLRNLSLTKLALVLGIAVGLSVGGARYVQAVEAAGGQQCYHTGSGTCETCSQTCLGSGYVCCTIVVDK